MCGNCLGKKKEAVWLGRFLQNLGVVPHATDSVVIHCDSMAALAYMKDPKYHGKSKHIETQYHYIRDIVAQRKVVLKHISTTPMVADSLTKPITRDVLQTHVRGLGVDFNVY